MVPPNNPAPKQSIDPYNDKAITKEKASTGESYLDLSIFAFTGSPQTFKIKFDLNSVNL